MLAVGPDFPAPRGFPLAYGVLPGNTSDDTTLEDFLHKIEDQYGQANRVWVMDRSILTEASLAVMRNVDYPIHYLLGTPKGRLSKFEQRFLSLPWEQVRELVDVKLLRDSGELYILAHSHGRMLILPRYTEPEKDQKLLLQRLQLKLPAQPPPRISPRDPQRQSAQALCSAALLVWGAQVPGGFT